MDFIRLSKNKLNVWTLNFIFARTPLARLLSEKLRPDIASTFRNGQPPFLNVTSYIEESYLEGRFRDATFIGSAEFKFGNLYLNRDGSRYSEVSQALLGSLVVFKPDFVIQEPNFVRFDLTDFLPAK
jgi:hypothetical protein